jgi:catechol 2,3-dioxygenase-like lactoylglutathione lyase family enzyme
MSTPGSEITGVDFVSVGTTDFEAAKAFYGATLGLRCSAEYGRTPGAEFETGNLTLQVIDSAAYGMEFQARTHPVALHVADVAAARADLEARGVSFLGDTIDTSVCHMAVFRDPDGNVLMLHHRYAPRSSRPV